MGTSTLPYGLAQLIANIDPVGDDQAMMAVQARAALQLGAGLDCDDEVTVGAVMLGCMYQIELAQRALAAGALTQGEAAAVIGVAKESARVWRRVLADIEGG